jgi:hypothetical protein
LKLKTENLKLKSEDRNGKAKRAGPGGQVAALSIAGELLTYQFSLFSFKFLAPRDCQRRASAVERDFLDSLEVDERLVVVGNRLDF